MNVLKKTLILAGCVVALGLGATAVMAGGGRGGAGGGAGGGFGGGRGGFNLDQARQDMDVKDDAEWTAISAKITAVQTARMAGFGGGRRRGGGGGPGGGGGAGGGAGAAGPTTPLADARAALQKAYDDKAPAADVKAAIAKVQNEIKANAAALTKAQDDLRSLLNARQEAYLMLNGGIL